MNTLAIWEERLAAGNPSEIIQKYLANLTPGAYEQASLKALEQSLHQSYQSLEELPLELKENLELYLAQGLQQSFGGTFIDLAEVSPDAASMIGLSYENLDGIDMCSTLVDISYKLKTGSYWASLFEANRSML